MPITDSSEVVCEDCFSVSCLFQYNSVGGNTIERNKQLKEERLICIHCKEGVVILTRKSRHSKKN